MATRKMTREEMAEKLASLQEGVKVLRQGKTYTVMGVTHCGGKLCRTDIGWLEDGKPETYLVAGKYLAAGRMIEMSNIETETLYARPMDMNFEIVA